MSHRCRTLTVQWYSPGGARCASHLIHASLGLPESTSQTVSRLVQPFLHSSRQNVVGHARACPSHAESGPHLIQGSLNPPEPITQAASRSVQPFLLSSRQSVPILYNGLPFTLTITPFPWGDLIHDSFSVSESTTQTASRLNQPFLHSSPQCSRAYTYMSFPLKIVSSHGTIRTPHPSQ